MPHAAAENSLNRPTLAIPQRHGWRLAPWHLLLVALWATCFCLLNRAPLQEPDLFGHAAYGRWILEYRTLPQEDPFLPLSGMRMVDWAWPTQVILAGAAAMGGGEALSGLFAATVLAAYLALARTFYLQSRSVLVAHAGVILVAAVGWSRTATARPEMFGLVCLAVLLWLLWGTVPGIRRKRRSRRSRDGFAGSCGWACRC